jgi:RAD50-interacting protein 1
MAAAALDEQQDTRLRDYLDDKLQTLADLESLDQLLLTIRNQHSLLQKQLEDAHNDLEEAKKASVQHASSLKTSVQVFDKTQRDIDNRLLSITETSTSEDAVRKFQASMEKMNRLDIAKGYIETLQTIERLR